MPTARKYPSLVALDAPARLAATGPLPSRIVMLKWGVNETAEGPVIVGATTLAASAAWPQIGYGGVCIDFEHNTIKGHPSYKGEPCKVAARSATLSVVPGVGLVFDNIQWTPDGEAFKANYRDLSPAVKLDDNGEVLFCHSAAVCRNGAVHGLHLFPEDAEIATLTAEIRTFVTTGRLREPTQEEQDFAELSIPEKLIKIFHLPDDCTDEDINDAMAAFLEAQAKEEREDPDNIAAHEREQQSQAADELQRQHLDGTQKLQEEGAMHAAKKQVAALKAYSAALGGITAGQREVNKRCGLSSALFLKHNPPAQYP